MATPTTTQKDRMLTYLKTQPFGASPWLLAIELGIPQPSVRRNIQELIAAGHNIQRVGSRWSIQS